MSRPALQNQASLGPDSYPRFAETAKLDVAQFRGCVSAGKYKSQIDDDIRDGTRLGVSGTPAFFINGVFVNGAVPAAAFKVVNEKLAGQARRTPRPAGQCSGQDRPPPPQPDSSRRGPPARGLTRAASCPCIRRGLSD